MDKRRKSLAPHEQLKLREAMVALVTEHPQWDVSKMLKEIRKSLHLTIHDMARVGRISVPALRNLEAGRSSPTLSTVDSLLRPLGLKLTVTQRPQRDEVLPP
jgi:XRE family transcriptional regulator, regulator of sulfur utilization